MSSCRSGPPRTAPRTESASTSIENSAPTSEVAVLPPATTEAPPTTESLPGVGQEAATPESQVPVVPAPTSDLEHARAMGVPGSATASVEFSGCWGRTDSTHWGYYNYLGTGTAVIERDGVVVQPGQICVNPNQASPYSTLLHELGHKWVWENGLWDRIISEYGTYQRGAECFAAIWGAGFRCGWMSHRTAAGDAHRVRVVAA